MLPTRRRTGSPDLADVNRAERVENQAIGHSWPEQLAPEAFHGLAGEIVSLLKPHSEADPVGLLMHLLVSFGNVIGRAAHFVVRGTAHRANLYCVNVGSTASRKGTAKDDTFFVIRNLDSDWFDSRVQSGLSSGEGFVWAVRDPIVENQPIREKGRVVDYQTVIVDQGKVANSSCVLKLSPRPSASLALAYAVMLFSVSIVYVFISLFLGRLLRS